MFYEQKPDPNGFVMMLPQMLSIIRSEAQRMSGQTDYITGNASLGSNKTKGGVEILTQNANIRNSTPTLVMGLGATRLLNLIIGMNQQFGKPEEPIYGDFNVKVFSDAMADTSTRIQVLQGMMPIIAQMSGNVQEVVKRILTMAGEAGIDMIFPHDGSMEKGQQNQGMAQLMQTMMGAQGGGRNAQ